MLGIAHAKDVKKTPITIPNQPSQIKAKSKLINQFIN